MTQFTPRSGEGGWGAARADLTPRWTVTDVRGPVAELIALGLGDPVVPLARWCEADEAAVVVGSGQRDPVPDAVRRRSGGSAVWVDPRTMLWLDVVVPRGDPSWHDDVGVAPVWLGEAWAAALADVGVDGAIVHTGAMVRSTWSAAVCFAGVGPGEVLVSGRKVVGISQRRTRHGALFQCAALLVWEPPQPEVADAAIGIDELLARPVDRAAVREAVVARLV